MQVATLNRSPDKNEGRAVFCHFRTYQPMTGGTINKLIKNVALAGCQYIDDVESKNRLKQVSAHWLRHTTATLLNNAGVDKSIIKNHLRHELDSATDFYIHKNVEELKDLLQKLTEGALNDENIL